MKRSLSTAVVPVVSGCAPKTTEEQIAALWSGHRVRVLDEVQKGARKIHTENDL